MIGQGTCLVPERVPAVLALANGSFFLGYSIGYNDGHTVGEVVFNTAMSGYQEILTDPSYKQQIVTLTYPHIGNVGVNPEDAESGEIAAAGLVVRELSLLASNWRAAQSLPDYLRQHRVIAIAGVDTRRLTRILRDEGASAGCIMVGTHEPAQAIENAREFPGMAGMDLTAEVTTKSSYEFTDLSWQSKPHTGSESPHVVVYDFGVKRQMMRLLVDRGCRVTVVPANTSYADLVSINPDGVLLSNGPGDPAACESIIAEIKKMVSDGPWPIFGICLGCQLLALSMGAATEKMSFGHHGANHPVANEFSKRVAITSQNHGFVVAAKDFPEILEVTHESLFDGTIQGFRHREKPVFAIQGHPEASPGPRDWLDQFDIFVRSMTAE